LPSWCCPFVFVCPTIPFTRGYPPLRAKALFEIVDIDVIAHAVMSSECPTIGAFSSKRHPEAGISTDLLQKCPLGLAYAL
jgi:hypothetical protein